jgi:PAS domain S-box-containing protein
VLAPTARDGEVTLSLLHQAKLTGCLCDDVAELCEEAQKGVGAILLTTEFLASDSISQLVQCVKDQPSWSDLPIILLMPGAHQSNTPGGILQAMGNVTLLEKPAPTRSVISALQTAVRARQRQYQIRDHIAASSRAESHMRELKEQLAIALEASELGTFHCPMPIDKFVWNDQCKAHFGLAPDAEVNADLFYQLIHPDDRESTRAAITACVEKGEPYDVEYRVRLPQGETRWIRATGKTYYNAQDQPIRFDGTTQDVSRQKVAEAELRTQAGRQKLLWDAAAVLLTAADPDTMMRTLFGKVSKYLGVDAYFNFMVDEANACLHLVSSVGMPEEALQSFKKLSFGEAVCGTVAIRKEAIVADHIQSSSDPIVQLIKGFGVRAYACNPLMSDGKLIGTLSFASRSRDSYDEAELSFFATLAHYVTTAYVKLQLVQRLKEADQRKDEFLATLAHELRNPLAPISNGFQVIRMAGDDRKLIDNILDTMERQLSQMVRLIDDLLDLSRITSNKLELRKDQVDLKHTLRDAIETSLPQIESSGHRLEIELPTESLILNADSVRLAQVFSNLLNNAAKYTPPRGNIWLKAWRSDNHIAVSVRDSGIGIAAENISRLFKMFSQITPALERSHGGLGIGLSLVRGLVEMHGGTVEASSQGIGQGSEFIVKLPLTAAAEEASCETAPSTGLEAPRRRVLVVDDNHDAAITLAMMIRMFGHEVHTVHDGQAAVEIAEAVRPDVVLLDIGLPIMNGYEACQSIRKQSWGEAIKIVALTGWGQDEDKRKARDAGFDQHFTKPVNIVHLRSLLTQ